MACCSDIILRCFGYPVDSEKVRKDLYKKDDDKPQKVTDFAISEIRGLCSKAIISNTTDYKRLAEKYIEIFEVDRDRILEADGVLGNAKSHFNGIVQPFSEAIASEATKRLHNKVFSESQVTELCSYVVAKTFTTTKA